MEKPILNRLNQNLKNLPVYQPGRPIEEVAREIGLPVQSIIKLASNENPLGPSPKAREAMAQAIHDVHLYPDGNAYYLKQALSQSLHISPNRIILGNGSNEIIEFIARAFVTPGSEVICSQYCFAIYPILTLMLGGKVVEVPARGLAHDLVAMANSVTDKTAAIFVANPNNPTGTLESTGDLERFVDSIPPHIPVIIDEAYIEYLLNPAPLIDRLRAGSQSNLFLMRTFSKIYGLAGLRLGYGMGDPDVIATMEKIRQPFNTNLMAQRAGIAALGDVDHLQRSRQVNAAGLEQLASGLRELDIEYTPSHCNFILARLGDAARIFQELQKLGVITRPMGGYRLPEWLRISVGTQEQNDRFLKALGTIV
ncbi:MAG: histidinol-phosphate transaminase [Verrucomicrobia bacterium]|nr:histidinol-phosphate transaminase [Verrucomicrobiota bacterium]